MKKTLAIVLTAVLLVGLLGACSSNPNVAVTVPEDAQTTPDSTSEATTEATLEPTAPEAAAAPLKTGLGVIASAGSSKDAAPDTAGLAQADVLMAAVLVDEGGKIIDCKIDSVQAKIEFDAAGKLSTPTDTVFASKNELGEAYGMKQASSIGKEWNEQADAFAQYAIGKTAEEVGGIAMTEGKPADADLAASVTIHIGDFIAVVQKAAANAKPLGAKTSDRLRLACTTEISKSEDADDEDGLGQSYTTMTAVTMDGDTITSCSIDAAQVNIGFSAAGKLAGDVSAEVKTKNELGDSYGMKQASSIGKEWHEQAAAFAQYVTDKTLVDVKGIAVTEGKAADADLASSVTIGITVFQQLLEKAAQ